MVFYFPAVRDVLWGLQVDVMTRGLQNDNDRAARRAASVACHAIVVAVVEARAIVKYHLLPGQ